MELLVCKVVVDVSVIVAGCVEQSCVVPLYVFNNCGYVPHFIIFQTVRLAAVSEITFCRVSLSAVYAGFEIISASILQNTS